MCQVNPSKTSKENTTILCFCMLKQHIISSRPTKQSQLFGTRHATTIITVNASSSCTSSKNLLLLSKHQATYLPNNTSRTGVQTTLFKQTKKPKLSKRKLRRSKNNTTVHEIIKMKCLDIPELFIDEEGDALGIPKL